MTFLKTLQLQNLNFDDNYITQKPKVEAKPMFLLKLQTMLTSLFI
jgi:hypothetical protein